MAKPLNAVPATTYYLSTNGKDTWSGTLPKPNKDLTDGPFATLPHVQKVLRHLRDQALLPGPVTVHLRGGHYPLAKPLAFNPHDSMPVTYASYPGEQAILDGGTQITGWKKTTVNGKKAWVTHLPEVEAGTWNFHQLFVNDQRRPRPRLPKNGDLFRIADVPGMPLPANWKMEHYDTFRLEDGAMQSFKNLADIDVVAFHFWIDERLPIASYDPDTQLITTSRASYAPLTEAGGSKLAPCFLDNVFEALTEPGEWYLDRPTGHLYYLPLPGETPAKTAIYAPRLTQLLVIQGDPANQRYVEWLRFENLTFLHTDTIQPGDPEDTTWTPSKDPSRAFHRHYRGTKYGSAAQAASDVTGVIQIIGARHCTIQNCRIAHLGWYGIDISDGCTANRIMANHIHDMGAGGIKIGGSSFTEPEALRTGNNQLTDNHIHAGGRHFHAATGILAHHTYGNTISHNHIHDLYYSGISCGWVWGYAPNIARDNTIHKNHIHDLGQGLLSDMGGVYLLGVQPGTTVCGNLIHDINKLNYGAWCLYTDEGSSHIILENNICFRTNGEVFHQHYGRENILRNNIFAFGEEALMAFSRYEGHPGFTLTRNILITHGPPIYRGGYNNTIADRALFSDTNLIWHSEDGDITFQDRTGTHNLKAWQKHGRDLHSIIADPKLKSIKKDNFLPKKTSPAWALGFEPIDTTDIGPRQTPGPTTKEG